MWWIAAIVLITNSVVLHTYGIAIRSTYAFVASGLVFYPLMWLNLVLGILVLSLLVWELVSGRNERAK